MLAEKFKRLKTAIGGNREKTRYEETFGPPIEEIWRITRPNKACTRIISELEFAMRLSDSKNGQYEKEVEAALDFLLGKIKMQGVITNKDCEDAEQLLAPMESAAKEYKLILASHAHIDMNWMWGFHETVAATLATFRSILNIMNEYPDFTYLQSQASVYKIVEEYDPEMMEEIKERIAQGRWEVVATAWVETDKNMPSTESLLRHMQYTKDYLSTVWNVKDFDVDFLPDTFGHNINVPEMDQFGEVKYFYHCRGIAEDEILYRYQSPSGKEVLTYREPNWYNGAITPHMGAGLIEISKKCAGLKTGLVIYGVGNHGGGPTRRDVERALDMMTWKIYPCIEFGTIRAFFKEAEAVREQIPVIKHELNYFAPGCYTTQSRIKRGNRRMEVALQDAEVMSTMANKWVGMRVQNERMTKAWRDVLFTHFHDILTGSCVQETREHALGLYQTSMATAHTQMQNAMRYISQKIDTSTIVVDIDGYNSQSEGAGAGYGIENFVGVPSTERGSGKTRIFHIFNTLPEKRSQVVELTVWDWMGDLKQIQVKDYNGNPLQTQLLDGELKRYWDHAYFRILVDVTVPAVGYTTIVLSERELEYYPVYLNDGNRVNGFFDDYVLKNDKIEVCLDKANGRIRSLRSVETGEELIQAGKSAGLSFLETEVRTSNAWNIGRHLKEIPVNRCIKIEPITSGPLRQSLKMTYEIEHSKVELTYFLNLHEPVIQMDMTIDWNEVCREIVPVLTYQVPLGYEAKKFRYDIPAGAIERPALTNDVPALQYGMALNEGKPGVILMSDCKYGYRGLEDTLLLTIFNTPMYPDPYPERGIHTLRLWLGVSEDHAKKAEELANRCNHVMFYQPSNCHYGSLPMEQSFLCANADNVVISAVVPSKDGHVIVRGYETKGKADVITLYFGNKVAEAKSVNLFEKEKVSDLTINDNRVMLTVEAYSLFEIIVALQ